MEVNEDRLIDLFIDLIKIDGVSKHERNVADFILEYLEKLGVSAEEDNAGLHIQGSSGNIIAHMLGDGQGIPIILAAHMDTVSSTLRLKPVIKNGKIQSDGETILGADDRAGIAAILEAINIIIENKIPHGPIELIFTVGEEQGLLGARNLDITKIQGKHVFVFDSSDVLGNIVNKTPICKGFTIKVKGRPAHAGVEPEKGINAIKAAALGLSKLDLGRIDEDTTANVGIIRGGEGINIVPEEVTLEGEVRSFDRLRMKDTLNRIFAAFNGLEKVEVSNSSELLFDLISVDEEDITARIIKETMEKCGYTPRFVRVGGGSDANAFGEKGLKALNIGIGCLNCHTKVEEIALKDLCSAANLGKELIITAHNKLD